MKSPSRALKTALASPLLVLPLLLAQDPAGEPPLAATIDGAPVPLAEYKDYLFETMGKRPLRALLYRKLVRREAEKLGVEIAPDLLAKEFEDVWNMLLRRSRGDAEKTRAELEAQGFSEESYRRLIESQKHHDLLCQAICRATRPITEESILARFEAEYGKGGERVEVRHVFWNSQRLRAELSPREGNPVSDEVLREELESRARSVLDALRDGADFAELAAANSHDPGSVQRGGKLAGYNYQRFGPELAEAVRGATVGRVSGPVFSQNGAHVFEVTEREVTKLEDVRETVTELVREAEADYAELRALEERLFAEAEIVTF